MSPNFELGLELLGAPADRLELGPERHPHLDAPLGGHRGGHQHVGTLELAQHPLVPGAGHLVPPANGVHEGAVADAAAGLPHRLDEVTAAQVASRAGHPAGLPAGPGQAAEFDGGLVNERGLAGQLEELGLELLAGGEPLLEFS